MKNKKYYNLIQKDVDKFVKNYDIDTGIYTKPSWKDKLKLYIQKKIFLYKEHKRISKELTDSVKEIEEAKWKNHLEKEVIEKFVCNDCNRMKIKHNDELNEALKELYKELKDMNNNYKKALTSISNIIKDYE